MFQKLMRALAVVPVGVALLIPTTAFASTGPSIVLGESATRAGLSLILPVQITCQGGNTMFFGPPASAQIHVVQANGNSAVAVGIGVLGSSFFGPPPPGVQTQPINCDGQANTYNVLIAPDLQTDPFTASFHGGPAIATGSLTITTTVMQCFPWGCFPVPQQQTLSAGPQTIQVKG